MTRPEAGRVLALCGGAGGAKLVLGLEALLGGNRLSVLVNTGDDFEHYGLHISPDIDTVLYTLAGLSHPVRGWGRSDESWNFMAALAQLGGETWFALGDRDLAIHVERTRRLAAGESLTAVVAALADRLSVAARILPMTDGTVRTIVHTADARLPFQQYFVKHNCLPSVRSVSFHGIDNAQANPAFLQEIADPELVAIVICPSNPYLSIDPILAVPGIRGALRRTTVPVVAVSPLIGGAAVKGPTAKIMNELGTSPTCRSIAAHYEGLIDGIVIDEADAHEADAIGVGVAVCRTLMTTIDDKKRLAEAVFAFAERLSRQRAGFSVGVTSSL